MRRDAGSRRRTSGRSRGGRASRGPTGRFRTLAGDAHPQEGEGLDDDVREPQDTADAAAIGVPLTEEDFEEDLERRDPAAVRA